MILIDGDKLADTFKDTLCDHLYCRECSFQLEDGGCKVEKWLDDAPTIEPMPTYIDNDLVVGHYANGMVAMNERAYQRLQLGQTERRE